MPDDTKSTQFSRPTASRAEERALTPMVDAAAAATSVMTSETLQSRCAWCVLFSRFEKLGLLWTCASQSSAAATFGLPKPPISTRTLQWEGANPRCYRLDRPRHAL